MTKKGPFFGAPNVRKSRRAKMGLPSSVESGAVRRARSGAARSCVEERRIGLCWLFFFAPTPR